MVRKRIWLMGVSLVILEFLSITACTPWSGDSESPIESAIVMQGTATSNLATQVKLQQQIVDSQQDAISNLPTQISSGVGSITETTAPLLLDNAPTPYAVCTPPACALDEMYHCPGDCPGGCGTECATATPGVSAGSGQVWGEICFPGETIPEMTIYFQEINTQNILDFPIGEGRDSYQLEIQPGVYVAFAWLSQKEKGGGFTKVVHCNRNVSSCDDHSLVPFLVQASHVTVGIDICDWNVDSTLFLELPEN